MSKTRLEEMWDKINGLETKVEGLELWAKGIGEEVGRLISPIRADENKKMLSRLDALEATRSVLTNVETAKDIEVTIKAMSREIANNLLTAYDHDLVALTFDSVSKFLYEELERLLLSKESK